MMGLARTSVASGHGEKVSSYLSVRSNLNAFGAIASASTLALGLVAVPPDFNGATTEVRAAQLAALARPAATSSAALLDKFIGNQAHTGASAVIGGADITTPLTFVRAVLPISFPTKTTPVIGEGVTDPTITVQQLDNAAPAIRNLLANPQNLLANVRALIGVAVLIGFFAVLGVVGLVVTSVGRVASAIKDILGGSGLQTLSAASDTARASEKADVSASATPTALVTETQQMSTDTGTSTKKVASKGATAANGAERPSGVSISKLAKAAVRSATPRPMVRNSLELGGHLRDLARRGNGGHSTARTAAGGDGAGTGESSSRAKSSADSSPAGSNSSGGDADGS
jgi:hypothetical protein